jgi:hypothetical protein
MIQIDPALPCAQVVGSGTGRICGRPATQGVVTLQADKTWELLPICAEHLREATEGGDKSPHRPPPDVQTRAPVVTP